MAFKKQHIDGPKEFRQTITIIKRVLKQDNSTTHLKRKRGRIQKKIFYGNESWQFKGYPAGSSGKVSYIGLSPFTQERTPSFRIFENKKGYGVFKCFCSGKGGDVFCFLMEYKKISFEEAVLFVLSNSQGRGLRDPNQISMDF